MRSAIRYDRAAKAIRHAARPGGRDDREPIRVATLAASLVTEHRSPARTADKKQVSSKGVSAAA